MQEKIATLAEFEPLLRFLFGPVEIDQEAWDRVAGTSARPRSWPRCRRRWRTATWTVDAIEAALRGVCEQLVAQAARRLRPVRVALTGTSISPGLFESVQLLGRDESLARLAAAAARLA